MLKKLFKSKHSLLIDGIKFLIISFLRGIQHLFWWVPIKNNRILLHVHNRRGFTCNPKYIALALIKEHSEDLDLYWASKYSDSFSEIANTGIHPLRENTLRYFFICMTSKVIITNDHRSTYIVKRKKQVLLNTWHGSACYKKIGFALNYKRNYFEAKIFDYMYADTDLFLSGCKSFSNSIPSALHVPQTSFVEYGTPRNDIFGGDSSSIQKKVKSTYHISERTSIILYAPTFRNNGMDSVTSNNIDFQRLLESLSQKWPGNWVCFFRSHYFHDQELFFDNNIIDVSRYEDMQELLVTADVFITDYSSAIWDFSLTGRPSFVYAPDVDDYIRNDRDFFEPISQWPYPLAFTNQDLDFNIQNFDPTFYLEKLNLHHQKLGLIEPGNASEIISSTVYKYCLDH